MPTMYPGTTAVTKIDHRPCYHCKHRMGEIPKPVSFYCLMLPIFKTPWFHISYQECQPNKAAQCKTRSFCRWISTKGNYLSNPNELVSSAETPFQGHFSSTAQRYLGMPCQFFNSLPLLQDSSDLKNHIYSPRKDCSQAEKCCLLFVQELPTAERWAWQRLWECFFFHAFPARIELHSGSRPKGFALKRLSSS